MANLMQNMLTLQNEHHIPMMMSYNTSKQIEYYKSHKRFDSPDILDEVIRDLEQKSVREYAAYIAAMKAEDGPNSQWYE